MKHLMRRIWTLAIAAALAAGGASIAGDATAAEAKSKAAKPAKVVQQSFESPEAAVDALIAAVKVLDSKALHAILGPGSEPLVESGDPVADREAATDFAARYEAKHSIAKEGDATAILETGEDAFPFPIPIVKDAAGWRFDTAEGQEEIIDRRIGRNELSAIQAALAFVDAQREYYRRNPEGSKLRHYARRFGSTAGKRDGLYWEAADGEAESPLGPLFAEARAEGYQKGKPGKPSPFHGYVFRMLDGQGPHAEGGAYSYVIKEQLIGGFGLIAVPATYEVSGVMTFIVNHDGQVYQKDLGPNTATAAAAIKLFDPDESWQPVADEEEATPPDDDGEATSAAAAP